MPVSLTRSNAHYGTHRDAKGACDVRGRNRQRNRPNGTNRLIGKEVPPLVDRPAHMCPHLTTKDSPDRRVIGQPILFGKVDHGNSGWIPSSAVGGRGPFLPHGQHRLVCENVGTVPRPVRVTVLRSHISQVVRLRPQLKMSWVATPGRVAHVHDNIVGGEANIVVDLIGYAVRSRCLARHHHLPVSSTVQASGPQKTSGICGGLGHALHKPVNLVLCVHLHGTSSGNHRASIARPPSTRN